MGPILILDKSALQSLSVDEAVWLHSFYTTNITPLFFVETLADLEKVSKKRRRSAEEIVGDLALKAAPFGARPNVHHQTLMLTELLGTRIEMVRLPVIGGGEDVQLAGRSGLVFRPSPEQQAFVRWSQSEFLEVERLFARAWRVSLRALDLAVWSRQVDGLDRPTSLQHAHDLAAKCVDRDGWRYRSLQRAISTARATPPLAGQILNRWKAAGGPPLREFAPYARHILSVDLFFGLALAAGLISDRRPSNYIDIAYLYYLPFCMAFVSGDWLHRATAPLFLQSDQAFIDAADLKADLAKLDAHFAALPEEVRSQGVMRFAQFPPEEGDFLTTGLWDRFMRPDWRETAATAKEPIPIEVQRALRSLLDQYEKAPRTAEAPPPLSEVAMMTLESRAPLRMGKWRLFPPEVRGDP